MTSTYTDQYVLLPLEQCLDAQSGIALKQQAAALDPKQFQGWIIDLSKVNLIDSLGLGALVATLKIANRQHCRLLIYKPCPSAQLMFEITGLDQVLNIVDTLPDSPISIASPSDSQNSVTATQTAA